MSKIIVLDTETTGLSCYGDEILQLAIIDDKGNVYSTNFSSHNTLKSGMRLQKSTIFIQNTLKISFISMNIFQKFKKLSIKLK